MSEDEKPGKVAVIAHYHPLAMAGLAAALLGAQMIRPDTARDEMDEILRGGGPRFTGYDPPPRSPTKRLLLGELNESNAPAPKPRKFRHNRKG